MERHSEKLHGQAKILKKKRHKYGKSWYFLLKIILESLTQVFAEFALRAKMQKFSNTAKFLGKQLDSLMAASGKKLLKLNYNIIISSEKQQLRTT